MRRREFFSKVGILFGSGLLGIGSRNPDPETIKLDIPANYREAWPMLGSDGDLIVMWTEGDEPMPMPKRGHADDL